MLFCDQVKAGSQYSKSCFCAKDRVHLKEIVQKNVRNELRMIYYLQFLCGGQGPHKKNLT